MHGIFFMNLLYVFLFSMPPSENWKAYTINGVAQGTTYHITYYEFDSIVTKKNIDSILAKLDSSISIYKNYSIISQFNNSAVGCEADEHLKEVVDKSLETYFSTKGIFDITVYPFTEAWGFGIKKTSSIPSPAIIKQLHFCVGSQYIYWSGNKLLKKKSCVKLDPNGIAQGYSVDVLSDFLEKKGINNYLVELGGEIKVKGRKQPGGEPMKIAIEIPSTDGLTVSLEQRIIVLKEGAVTTSGSYRKFYESKGRKISHIIDARTGYPSANELISVTVFAADAITADAYDNALMVMGLSKALSFTEKRKEIAAHFVYRKKDGSIADTASKKFYSLLKF